MNKQEPFTVSVNDQYTFEILPEAAHALDIYTDKDGAIHMLHGGKSYHATVVSHDPNTRSFIILINGTRHRVHIADHYERLLSQLGLTVGGAQKMNTVKAPMPGLVLSILVEAGQTVQKGDPLLILEAMKMENVLKSTGEGIVKKVVIAQGTAVEKGQLLLEME